MEDLSIYNRKFVYVKGEDNTMADVLSRYLSTHTTSNIIAQHNAQHPYIRFDKDSIVVLNHSLPTPTPLTAIAALTKTNPQRTKIEFSIDDDTVTKL
jgi:DNA-directed RNA polymerase subunit L